jgi:hypothetical protein
VPDEELVILIRHGPSSMKYKLWERHTSSKSPVYKLNIQQFEPLLALKNQLAALKKLNTQGYTIKVLTIKLASLLRNKKIGTYCSINPDTIVGGYLPLKRI